MLHQLVYAINQLGGQAKIAYFRHRTEKSDYTNPAFEKYVNDYVIVDELYAQNDITVVIPETRTEEVLKFHNAQIFVWWMSVDNYYNGWSYRIVAREKGAIIAFFEIMAKAMINKHSKRPKYISLQKMQNVTLHLAQSQYAYHFLNEHGLYNVAYLSDYINEDYINNAKMVDTFQKEDIVLYNPKKGYKFTKKIIDVNPDIQFVPLSNMDNNQVVEYMRRAKLYIDFGSHPGKDRMPREAVLMGCCIITGRRGAAAYDDIPIAECYKIADEIQNIPKISSEIKYILKNYTTEIEKFTDYQKAIMGEQMVFQSEVKKVFDL